MGTHRFSQRFRERLRVRSSVAIVAATVLGMALASCASGGAGPADAGSAAPTTVTPQPVPGTVTLDLSDVTGAENLVMVAMIGDPVPARAMGAVCELGRSDPFGFTGSFKPITGDDPCTLGSEAIEFEPGVYEVIVAVMPGGARTPEQCTRTTVTVDGDVTVRVNGLGATDSCGF